MHFFVVNAYNGCNFLSSLLETVGIRIPSWNFRDFSLFLYVRVVPRLDVQQPQILCAKVVTYLANIWLRLSMQVRPTHVETLIHIIHIIINMVCWLCFRVYRPIHIYLFIRVLTFVNSAKNLFSSTRVEIRLKFNQNVRQQKHFLDPVSLCSSYSREKTSVALYK
jgi:hypothetical protein